MVKRTIGWSQYILSQKNKYTFHFSQTLIHTKDVISIFELLECGEHGGKKYNYIINYVLNFIFSLMYLVFISFICRIKARMMKGINKRMDGILDRGQGLRWEQCWIWIVNLVRGHPPELRVASFTCVIWLEFIRGEMVRILKRDL